MMDSGHVAYLREGMRVLFLASVVFTGEQEVKQFYGKVRAK